MDSSCGIKLSGAISDFLSDALKVVVKNPAMTEYLIRITQVQKKSAKIRFESEKQGLQVPPYMIISITNKCNLACKGCYFRAQHRQAENEMSGEKLRSVIGEAGELGILFILLAGGEPLMRPDILDITRDNKNVIFPLFTNGLLITEDVIARLAGQRNVVPIISMEGYETDTDGRRGQGVYGRILASMEKMRLSHIFYGLSFTVKADNFNTLTDEAFISGLIASGCQLFIFVEYVPVSENTENLTISQGQREALAEILSGFKKKFKGLFVSFPGDEKDFGGCLSAGRGFVHVSATGDLEPCPFAPYSDVNLNDMSLKEALKSSLLSEIRNSGEKLAETTGGCALWNEREWVRSLLKNEKR